MKLIMEPRNETALDTSQIYYCDRLGEVQKQRIVSYTKYKLFWEGDELRLAVQVYMPVWEYSEQTRPEEIEEWTRFWSALLYHERGHILLSRNFARYTLRVMEKTAPDMRDSVFKAHRELMKTCHADYDRVTEHGVKQNTPHGPIVLRIPDGCLYE